MREPTPPQTVGPFFHPSLTAEPRNLIAGPDTEGERIRIEGRVCDGAGEAVDDAMVEIWQADAQGRYRHPLDAADRWPDASFIGFGRAATDASGSFRFDTIKPGPVQGERGRRQAPHLNVQVFARGLLDHLSTRLYFEDEAANEDDEVLARVPEERRATLVARRVEGEGAPAYRFDIVLQGDGETVFFDA